MQGHRISSSISSARVRRAVEEIAAGRMVVVLDDADRENEGDFVAAGSLITPETVNLMASRGRGLICIAISQGIADRLDLPPQTGSTSALHGTNFTVSVDAIEGTTTGISAADRAKTIRILSDPSSKPEQLARPGHIFPIVAHPGGMAARRGHTEAAVWLAETAGVEPAAVICEIMSENGEMAVGGELERLAEELGMAVVHVDELAGELGLPTNGTSE